MIAIPFACTDWSSFHELKGLIRLEDDEVVLEYRVNYWGCYSKAKVHEVRIPREVVSAVGLREGWFSDQLTIQTASLRAWGDFNGAPDGRARLQVSRGDRDAARELVAILAPEKMVEPVDEYL
ncbi:hypothetical protein [Tautonia marina]|uniref:hypothetical protein n=1 Tax=Tautonia marina TaxID=2653855 RepID=UPI0013759AEA|nr:hypothetical protein [Tautonia marina]